MTVSLRRQLDAAASVHEHAWVTESVHATSEGRVRYVRCATCPTRRVDAEAFGTVVPRATTREIG